MNPDSWKMVVNNVLTYKGFIVRILEVAESREGVTKMEALNTEFLSQEKIIELAALGFVKDLDGNYIYDTKLTDNETQTT